MEKLRDKLGKFWSGLRGLKIKENKLDTLPGMLLEELMENSASYLLEFIDRR